MLPTIYDIVLTELPTKCWACCPQCDCQLFAGRAIFPLTMQGCRLGDSPPSILALKLSTPTFFLVHVIAREWLMGLVECGKVHV